MEYIRSHCFKRGRELSGERTRINPGKLFIASDIYIMMKEKSSQQAQWRSTWNINTIWCFKFIKRSLMPEYKYRYPIYLQSLLDSIIYGGREFKGCAQNPTGSKWQSWNTSPSQPVPSLKTLLHCLLTIGEGNWGLIGASGVSWGS